MSSILLGPLATKNNLKSVYNSDIENKMNNIEKTQAKQNFNKPEYLNQFDDLRLDNISVPVSVNQTHATTLGVNSSLQRDLEFKNGYSNFQMSDMHYDVVSKEDFYNHNMIPNTSKRDMPVDLDRHQRKLETFTGVFEHYTPKKEKLPLFEPMIDLTYVNGMPAITGKIQNRYIPSNKNNYGNLPFKNNVKVRPGMGLDNQEGNYAVYRVNPRNIDALRSEINQKVTFENKPLETVKKGEIRGPDFNLTKYKLPDFRETKFDDLVASRAEKQGMYKSGKYTNVITQRNETENYKVGPAVNTNMGLGPDKKKTKFEPSKRENYLNDNERSINAVDVRPVMTNIKSFNNYETQRATTNSDYQGPLNNTSGGINYTIDYNDIPLTTTRELLIHGDNNIGIVGSQQKSNYVFSNDMVLPVTQRQTMDSLPILGASAENKLTQVYNMDKAKDTIRQGTSHNIAINTKPQDGGNYVSLTDDARYTIRQDTSHNLAINAKPQDGGNYVSYTDDAKDTIRQQTSHNLAINTKPQEGANYVSLTDNAKPTIKESTIITDRQTGNIRNSSTNANYTRDLEDTAKTTIRQTTEINNYIGGISSQINEGFYSELNDNAKVTIKQTTLHSTPGGRVNNNNMGNYAKDINDKARPTIKQTTLLQDYKGPLSAEVDGPTSQVAARNMCIDERREVTTFNRPANGKGDDYGPYIDPSNVRMNDRRMVFNYVPHPHKSLDHSVMPTTSREIIEKVYSSREPEIDMSGYYINPNFINTLKNNPLVNDIYHQKNV
jgi:hypothetical protein